MLPDVIKNPLRKLRSALGLSPQPRPVRPALNGLDVKLERYLDFDGGFFIEAGANDGFTQSNTYYFEKHRGWSGILVEGIPDLYRQCLDRRPASRVFNCALVSSSFTDSTVTMRYANLMSIVEGARGTHDQDTEFINKGLDIQHLSGSFHRQVPARTLTSILDECGVRDIDLFSLDVEGYEGQVLHGLDLTRYRPRYICVEVWNPEDVEGVLAPYYVRVDNLTERDVLYRAK